MENIEEDNIDTDEAPIGATGFAAIPIHFRPGKQTEKRFKLVIPGLEPPIAFFILSGDEFEDLELTQVSQEDIDSVATEPTGDIVTPDDDTVITDDEDKIEIDSVEPMNLEDVEDAEKMEEEAEAIDRIIDDATPEGAEDEIMYLIAIEPDTEPAFIEFTFNEGESKDEGVSRAAEEYPEYRVGTLEDVDKLKATAPSPDKDY